MFVAGAREYEGLGDIDAERAGRNLFTGNGAHVMSDQATPLTLTLALQAKAAKLKAEAQLISIHGSSKSKGPVHSTFVSPRQRNFGKGSKKNASRAPEATLPGSVNGGKDELSSTVRARLAGVEEESDGEVERDSSLDANSPLSISESSLSGEKMETPATLSDEFNFVAECVKKCDKFYDTSPDNTQVIANLFYPAECSMGQGEGVRSSYLNGSLARSVLTLSSPPPLLLVAGNSYVTGKCTSTIHADPETIRNFLEVRFCEERSDKLRRRFYAKSTSMPDDIAHDAT